MISIIIPTLNEESVIGDTLQALKSKLTLPHEIIVSDGRSKDRTVEIAKKYADRVVEYAGEKRQTIARGRNDGARAAAGDFLAFMDADCSMPDPDAFFIRALSNFNDPKLIAVVPWIRVLPSRATAADRIIFYLNNSYLLLVNNILGFAVSGGELQMMRKKDFDKVGGYDERLVASEDVDLLQRLSRFGQTRLDRHLIIFHTGRRAHKIGWPKLLCLWVANSISMMLRKKAYSSEWTPIR
jgi:glycosyltransferase involved in cell wall biosynthesis